MTQRPNGSILSSRRKHTKIYVVTAKRYSEMMEEHVTTNELVTTDAEEAKAEAEYLSQYYDVYIQTWDNPNGTMMHNCGEKKV